MILSNNKGIVYYDSDKHIKNDTRIKNRCRHYLVQFYTRTDPDGKAQMGACIGLSLEELADLERRGVKNYQCNFPNGSYTISLPDIRLFGIPVEYNREGDGDQIAVSVRHWDFNGKPEKKSKKAKKDTPAPLPAKPVAMQMSMFGR
jgi:hypothetical protein